LSQAITFVEIPRERQPDKFTNALLAPNESRRRRCCASSTRLLICRAAQPRRPRPENRSVGAFPALDDNARPDRGPRPDRAPFDPTRQAHRGKTACRRAREEASVLYDSHRANASDKGFDKPRGDKPKFDEAKAPQR